jgi:putative heme transporter
MSSSASISQPEVKIRSDRVRSWLWIVTETAAIAVVATIAVLARGPIGRSVAAAIDADGYWVGVTFAFELVSIATFARTQRIILRGIGGYISISWMAATGTIGNAISFSLPLIGPGAGTAFTYRRFVRFGSDPAAATWALGTAWMLSTIAWTVMLIVGALVSGNLVASVAGALSSAAILLGAIAVIVALRRPGLRRLAGNVSLKVGILTARLRGRVLQSSFDLKDQSLSRFLSFRMSRRRWAEAGVLSLMNWFCGAACLVAAILAVRAQVPWSKVLLVYSAGSTVSSFNLTPGGLGVVEGTLTAGLVGSGLSSKSALGAVLIFRTATFWVPMAAGWLLYGLIDRRAYRPGPEVEHQNDPSTGS